MKHDPHAHGEAAAHQHADVAAVAREIDPVCGMSVVPRDTRSADFEGHRYFFCCDGCRTKFVADPGKYLQPRPVAAAVAGPVEHSSAFPAAAPAAQGSVYTCPMHPEIRQQGPGSCPICGMALEPLTVSLEPEDDSELRSMTRR